MNQKNHKKKFSKVHTKNLVSDLRFDLYMTFGLKWPKTTSYDFALDFIRNELHISDVSSENLSFNRM